MGWEDLTSDGKDKGKDKNKMVRMFNENCSAAWGTLP